MMLTEIWEKYKSDKGTVHSYIPYYEKVLQEYKNTENGVLEIGVSAGLSIKMWREYFSNAKLYGNDLRFHQYVLDWGLNVNWIKGNQSVNDTFKDLNNLDVVIDDGSHRLKDQIKSFNILWPKLNPGGIYIIEDIRDIDGEKEHFTKLHKNVFVHDFRKLKDRSDDVIIEIRKDGEYKQVRDGI